ncbi:lysozyme inhibitor LprI family protein [Acinetobacter pittii]|uniref:lysozyme inhibitor LprI family protein n=1 Tax=Acinetobacter pittii TaxID=48296 RepID=UPI0032B43D97
MKILTALILTTIPFASYAMCENERSNGTTISIYECYKKEVQKSDKKIMQVYTNYKNTLSANEQKNLLEVQRSWISYKMKQCNFEVASYGTIAGQLHAQCMINMNNRRINELKYMQDCGLESSSNFCMNYRPA